MRLSFVFLAFSIALSCAQPVAAQSVLADAAIADGESASRQALEKQIASAWRAGDYRALNTLGEDFAVHHSKTDSGKSKLELYFVYLTRQVQIEWPDEWLLPGQPKDDCNCKATDPSHYAEGDRRWAVVEAKLAEWAKRFPRSAIVPVVRAQYFMDRAWFYRGNGYASNVYPEAWPRFEQYMHEAEKTLKASTGIRDKDPAWFREAAMIAVANDWPAAEREQLYNDMTQHGQLYTAAFMRAAQFMLPQWGGSYADIEALMQKAAQSAPQKDDGLEFYARVNWTLLDNFGKSQKAAQKFGVDWPMMKTGLEVIIQRYPVKRNLSGAAKNACRFGDAELFERTMRQLGIYEPYSHIPLNILDCAANTFLPDDIKAPPH